MGITACCGAPLLEEEEPSVKETKSTLYTKVYGRSKVFSISPSKFVLDNSKTLKADYEIEKVMGSGAYGVVYKAIHIKSGEARAIKRIDRSKANQNDERKFLREIDILKHLDHPNIMKIYEFAVDSKSYSIISEFIPGGELFDVIEKQCCFSEVDAAYLMRQLLSAIAYCHSMKVIHRDLKPENILIDSIKGTKINVKIIDFGGALVCSPNKAISEKVGTVYYVAPDILRGAYTSKCDVWSLGVIMYVLLSGRAPFNGRSDREILNAILKGVYHFPARPWNGISSEAKDLIEKMLTYNPDMRISAAEAYKHPWFQICDMVKLDPAITAEVLRNIKGFNAKSKLQKAAMMYIVSQLMTKRERDKLQEVFLALDKNGDGKLNQSDILDGYMKVFKGDKLLAKQEAEGLINTMDLEKTGEIDYSDFLLVAANKRELLTLKNMREAFNAFDLDGCGYILPEEVKTILGAGKKLDEKVWKEIIAEVDITGDGKISYAEFEHMLKKYLS